jgi:hypothetical protein
MNAQEIQNICIAGTDAYLNYLVENNRGLERIRVIHKETLSPVTHPRFKLTLARRLFDPDCVGVELKPPTRTYGPDSFRVVKYDGDAMVLIIEVLNPELALDATPAENLWIVSDLRFIVKNVRRWYESNGLQVRLPQVSSAIPRSTQVDQESQTTISLETCQKEAVARSLENPLTYVWGPPGTGKTKHVLTQASLQLLRSQKRIGILAPTNHALEQAMTAVIYAAEAVGITRERFLRAGHPSTKFAESFPEVCEVQGLQKRVSELEGQIKNYEAVLNHRRGATVLNSVASLRHEIGRLQGLLCERRGVYEELAQMRKTLWSRAVHFFDSKTQPLEDRLSRLETQINGSLEMIRRTQTESPKLNAMLERVDFSNVDKIDEDVKNLENAARQFMGVNQALAEEYKDQINERLQRLITDLKEQLEALKAQTALERMKSAWVTGMTLDCFIGRFHDTLLPFDHVFLDEAGYAPLVKAMTLCRGGIPLTFIGDHKQLGPVCEMDDENLNTPANSPAIIWRKSALFVDEVVLAENQDALVTQLFELNEPRLKSFIHARLNRTFRFGQNLADLLSTHVYKDIELLSAENHRDLEIVCLNAVPTCQPEKPWQSLAEVEAISSFLHEQPNLNTDNEEAFAILTPYKNQVALIGKSLLEVRRQGRIMTIHKSQGREWDTVIVSIVDGRFNRPWFTDTTNTKSGGIYVMNTAISRARKRLVIVCDADYWFKKGVSQLVSQLLKLAN